MTLLVEQNLFFRVTLLDDTKNFFVLYWDNILLGLLNTMLFPNLLFSILYGMIITYVFIIYTGTSIQIQLPLEFGADLK